MFIANVFKKIKMPSFKNMPILLVFDYFLVLMTILCSGYALFTTGDSTPRTIFTCITFVLVLVRFVLNLNPTFFKSIKTNKKLLIPLPTIICFVLIGLSATGSLFINSEGKYFISYFYFGILVITGFLLCRTISFQRFRKIFCDLMFGLSIISILLFVIFVCINKAIGVPFENGNNNVLLNSFFINSQNLFYNRIQSIFWEPGVFASYLLIALSFELLIDGKLKISHLLIFVIALILTFSTAGYLLLLLIVVPFFIEKIKNRAVRLTGQILFFPILLISAVLIFVFAKDLANILPSVFSKVAKQTNSFTTRLLSPKINFEMFLSKPLFGWGIHGSNAKYLEIASSTEYLNLIDAQTSTTVGLLARFGVLGSIYTIMAIVGIVFWKKSQPLSLVAFVVLFLAIINKEPHGNMLVSWAIPFYFMYEAVDKIFIKKRKLSFINNPDISYLDIETNPILNTFSSKTHTGIVARNTALSLGLKGLAIFIGLFTIPVYSSYFGNDSTYGIWLTFLSIITWVMTFDLGFGNGMKNKLIKTISDGDDEEGKRIVSSTYAMSLLVGGIILTVGILVITFLDPVKIFNFDSSLISPQIVKIAFCITFATIAIEFVLKNVCHIFQAYQRHFLSNLLPLIASVGLLIFALLFKTDDLSNKLLFISIAYSAITLIPYLLASIIAFVGPLRKISPSFKFASFKKSRSVASLGLTFFLMQLALLFLNSIDQMLISLLFSSDNVVFYTKYIKFFNTIFSITNIFSSITWTSICKSVADNNKKQLKKGIISLLTFDAIMIFVCFLIALFMQPLMDVWLGDGTFTVNPLIVIFVLVFTILNILVTSSGAILNGFQYLIPRVITLGVAAVMKIGLIIALHFIFSGLGWDLIIIVDCLIWAPMLLLNIIFILKCLKKWKASVNK